MTIKETYRAKSAVKQEKYISRNNEIKLYLQKKTLSHFSVRDIVNMLYNKPLEFIALTSSTWFPHDICVKNPNLQFKVLCDSNKGPAIIEHSNSIVCNFHISSKYKDTVKLLENFIRNKFFYILVHNIYILGKSKPV